MIMTNDNVILMTKKDKTDDEVHLYWVTDYDLKENYESL